MNRTEFLRVSDKSYHSAPNPELCQRVRPKYFAFIVHYKVYPSLRQQKTVPVRCRVNKSVRSFEIRKWLIIINRTRIKRLIIRPESVSGHSYHGHVSVLSWIYVKYGHKVKCLFRFFFSFSRTLNSNSFFY